MILLLVALSLAPLVYTVKGANVATVVVNGKVVVRNRRMETVDEGEVLAKPGSFRDASSRAWSVDSDSPCVVSAARRERSAGLLP